MNSFYGGKQGRTYHIVKRYDSVELMVTAFKNGGACTEVNYGQYVLIDTVLNRNNRSERENGLLYRRGFNYTQDLVKRPTKSGSQTDQDFYDRWSRWVQHPGGGAIYIGQIVGPEGRTPEVSLEQWKTFLNQSSDDENETFGSKSTLIINDPTLGHEDKNISVGYINIKTPEGDTIGGYLSINIPKLEIEAILKSASPYTTAKIEENNDSKQYPFWYKWDFTIPSGKHGQDITEIKVETGSDIIQGGQNKDASNKDIVAEDQYLTYSTKNYDRSAAGTLTKHLGRWPYRVINNITPQNSKNGDEQSGMLLQSWSPEAQVREAALLDNLGLDSSGNRIVAICTKAGTTGTEQPNFTSKLNQTISDGSSENAVSWLVTTLPASAPADTLQVNYTAGDPNTFDYRQIEYTFVNDIGQMFVVYSDQPNNAYYITEVLSLKTISFDSSSGWLTVYYNNNNQTALGIPTIQNISFPSEDIDAVQKFKLTYKSSYEPSNPISQNEKHSIYISEEFDRIIDIRLNGDNVVVLHSSPTVRNNIPNEKKVSLPYNDSIEKYDWQNLGPLGGEYHIQGEYSYNDLLGIPGEPGYIDLSNGFTGNLQDRAGWIVTVTDGNTKHIYAYDYNHTEGEKKYTINGTPTNWYQIMTIDQKAFDPKYSVFVGETSQDNILNEGGIWFELSEGHTPHSN